MGDAYKLKICRAFPDQLLQSLFFAELFLLCIEQSNDEELLTVLKLETSLGRYISELGVRRSNS